MSMHDQEHSSTPEESDQYCFGDYYFHLRAALQHAQKFTVKAYLPNNGGIRTVTNQNTANGSLRIIDGNNLREPDESELMYFTKDTTDLLELDVHRLKDRRKGETYNPEKTGVYRKIDPKVLERVLNESPPAPEKTGKKAG